MTYTVFNDPGLFVNGVSPAQASTMNDFRAFCLSGWFDSQITSNGAGALTMVQLLFSLGSLTRWSKFTGSATVTSTFFNHNLGVTPDFVILQLNGTSATAHSLFVDFTSFSTTQVKITSDGNNAFVGLAIKF